MNRPPDPAVNVYIRLLHATLGDAQRELGREDWAYLLDHAERRVVWLREGRRAA
jgi:hypothetical protein